MKTIDNNCFCGSCLECNFKTKCITITNQCIEVATPIRLEAITNIKKLKVECGEPKICSSPMGNYCTGKNNCEFVVKQKLFVEIPIMYHVKTDVGENRVECNFSKQKKS